MTLRIAGWVLTGAVGVCVLMGASGCSRSRDVPNTIPVQFSGGHEIGEHDFGRPVALIAAALGVEPGVFREAFSGVTPAQDRAPTGDEARANKAALLNVLEPLGVTNERLDEVSDYYRFRPQDGELWPTREADAHAVITHGQISQIVVTDSGSGYSSPPTVRIDGFPKVECRVTLGFNTEFGFNGSVTAIELR